MPFQLQRDIGGGAGQPAHSGMACFVDTGYCCLFCRSFPDYFPIVDAGETLARGGYWKRGIPLPSMCCVIGESGGLVKAASGGRFHMTGKNSGGSLWTTDRWVWWCWSWW